MAAGRIATANSSGSVELLYNRHQDLFLQALEQKTPNGKQFAFNVLSLFSGRQGGKTRIGALGSVKKMRNPGWWMWICGPTYPDLTDFIIPTVFAHLPESWIEDWLESRLELVLKNKTRVQFRSLDDPDKARGPGLNFAWLDEAAKIQKLAWHTMLPALSSKNGQAIFTTTPKGYDWCYDELWVPAAVEPQPGYWACKYHTKDNPIYHSKEMRARLEADRARMDPVFFQQEYEAEFVSFTGAVYGPLLAQKLILRTDDEIRQVIPEWPNIDPSREVIGGLDPGADHPFAGVLLVITDKGLVQIGEYLERNRPVQDHHNGLVSEMCGKVVPGRRPLVPAKWAIDKSQKQWAMELQLLGMPCVPANNDVIAGINRVKAWMRLGQIYFIEKLCPKTIKQLQGYAWAENVKDGETKGKELVIKKADDLPDALRYTLQLYQEPSRIELTDYMVKRAAAIAKMDPLVQWALERNRRCEGLIEKGREPGLQVYGEDLEEYGTVDAEQEGDVGMQHFFA